MQRKILSGVNQVKGEFAHSSGCTNYGNFDSHITRLDELVEYLRLNIANRNNRSLFSKQIVS